MSKEKILVHTCCATCAGYVIAKLSAAFTPVIYFSNSNIHPQPEYDLRREELKHYSTRLGLDYAEDIYAPTAWLDHIKGLEHEPEKGARCSLCFRLRLEKTAQYALENKITIFTTTLTISPHKNSAVILETGRSVAADYQLHFWAEDFKKENGFQKSMVIAKAENFYRQNYCGCIFSKR